MDQATYLAALEKELDGYTRRGLTARADAVRAEIARLGGSPGATPREVVLSEAGSAAPKPTTRTRKPAEPTKKAPAPKTPKRTRGGS